MNKWLLIVLVSVFTLQASAEECVYKPPAVVDLPYKEGAYIPVYFSRYQFNLPSRPDVLLSSDGFIASYPEKGYIGHQDVDVKPWHGGMPEGNLPAGIADSFRLLYGTLPTDKLDHEALAQVEFQRDIHKLDCNARVRLYRVGGAVDVIWQERRSAQGFHTIWVLGDERAELITISGSNEVVLQVISSIKKRM
jgi:hypothetical protein